ncbi:Tautomerase/MIF [Mollisia scopiformis]|uniref:L-dopachrome isomerase n=1 Tax=Mollisia scopiformis TaxID=149040 RepID=A0A194WY72_MOLSC|nr:Tautomerase/MIF [Mollisia scopiformis]KUJ12880.1 Tautomerase/MIF [Mollisia scopiformis]
MSKEARRITRDLTRGSPGDQAIFSNTKTAEQKTLAKRKSQYYGEVFANREPIASARERIQDEFTIITDLSSFLSTRFQRPENSIIVSLSHSCCMLYGGNFDPAYTLTITALTSQLQPVTNKRNAALLAKHMEESLGVESKRGVIKFVATPEENLAVDGKTIAGEIEELEKATADHNSSLQRSLSRGTNSKRRQSMKSLRGIKTSSQLPTHNESMVSLPSTYEQNPPMPAMPSEKSTMDKRAEKAQRIGRRKSFMATIFGK